MRSTRAISRSWTIAPDLFDKRVVRRRSKAFLAAPTNWRVVAALHGQIIGKCTALLHLRPDKKVELYIDGIDGIEKWRRNGIARAQWAKIPEMARNGGCEECWLGSEKDNIAARGLYESDGAKGQQSVLYHLKF